MFFICAANQAKLVCVLVSVPQLAGPRLASGLVAPCNKSVVCLEWQELLWCLCNCCQPTT